ncbi:hypothetical protein MKX03_003022 [Papaver bracteatum]|nr:hypothetical protein MKX03_003022 [Papaver bracteatum]
MVCSCVRYEKGSTFFLLLKCELLEVIDRQNCDVHQIILHQFQKNSVLLFLVNIYVSTRFYLARIDSCQHFPLLTSEIYDKIMIQHGVRQFILSSLHLSSFSCDFRISVHHLLPTPTVYPSCLLPVGILMETQIFVVVFQLLKILVWVGYLRWKFILVPTALCSVGYISCMGNNVLSEGCLVINWNSKSIWFCDVEVQISAILMILPCWHLDDASRLFSIINGTSIKVCRRLLFDRGKWMESILFGSPSNCFGVILVYIEVVWRSGAHRSVNSDMLGDLYT